MASWASSILFTAELISPRSSAAIAFISPRNSFISPRNSVVEAVRSAFVTDASPLDRMAPTIASACLDSIPAASSERAALRVVEGCGVHCSDFPKSVCPFSHAPKTKTTETSAAALWRKTSRTEASRVLPGSHKALSLPLGNPPASARASP